MHDNLAILPLSKLRPSPRNPRRHFDDARQAELVASIRAKGLLQPLLVRPLIDEVEAAAGDQGSFEIIAGHRRLAAALALGFDEVPVRILELPGDEAFEVAITENLQRADMKPLEEARAFGEIAGLPPRLENVQRLAERLGKPAGYVWDRLRLLDLIPDAQQLLERGLLPVAHAQLLARLDPEQQVMALRPSAEAAFTYETALDFDLADDPKPGGPEPDLASRLRPCSLAQLRQWIGTHVRFNPMQAAIAAPLEFQHVADQVLQAHLEPGRGKKVVHITHDYHVHPEAKGEERTYCGGSWRRADEACDRTVLGVIVTGPGYGQSFPVCVHKDCPTHWADEIRRKEKERKAQQANPGKAAQDESAARKRQEEERAKADAAREAYKKAIPAIKAATIAALKKAKPLSLAPLLVDRANNRAMLQAFGPVKTTDDLVRLCALQQIWWPLTNEYGGAHNFPPIAKRLGVDLTTLLKGEEKPPVTKKTKVSKKRR